MSGIAITVKLDVLAQPSLGPTNLNFISLKSRHTEAPFTRRTKRNSLANCPIYDRDEADLTFNAMRKLHFITFGGFSYST